jgi:hypothetical protein
MPCHRRLPVRIPSRTRVLPAGRVRLARLAFALATLPGCRGCNDDTPYTPFGVASSAPDAAAAPSSATAPPSASVDPTGFAPRSSVEAKPGTTSWQLGERKLDAPDGTTFVRAVVGDFDDDGKAEAAAVLSPAQGVAAELWSFPASGAPRQLWRAPDYLPNGPGCQFDSILEQTGPSSVTVEVTATCSGDLLERVPTRALAVIAPLAASPLVLAVRAAAAAPGEQLDLRVRSPDQDGDGRDDVLLDVVVGRQGSRELATARLEWLDRAAGPSRVPGLPLASLDALARAEVVRAPGKNTGKLALERVANTRRLLASLCAEAGTPRLFDGEGSPFACGNLATVNDQLATAEVLAWLAQDDVLSAAGVLTRDGWYHARLSEAVRRKLTEKIESRLTRVDPTQVSRLLATTPRRQPTAVRWSPLAFEQPEPTLLVRTPAGLIRATADGSREEPANPNTGARPWSLDVEAGPGLVWRGVEQACEHSELLATFGTRDRRPLTEILAARPGACGGGQVPPVPAPIPLGPASDGLEAAIVAGARVGSATTRSRPGLARSPDGSYLVAPTTLGILVLGAERPELWSAPELTPTHALSDCVVANQASAIACVKGTEVILAKR